MLNTCRWYHVAGCAVWLASATPATANLCDKPATPRARSESSAMLNERFAYPNSAYGGDANYNARIITCNRARDTKGNEIEKSIKANHAFPTDLPPRVVKGHFNYLGLAPAGLRYAYQIERSGSVWTITVPMRFHWPAERMPGVIDISGDLATRLGLNAAGEICDPAMVKRSVDGTILQGFIRMRRTNEDIQSIGANDVAADDSACRIPRNLNVGSPGRNVLQHLQEYFRDELDRVWGRPGFRINGIIINPQDPTRSAGTYTAADLTAWEKDETIWDLHLNLDPSHRASYKRWTFKWNHMYSGAPGWVIAHEFGHVMGLDDEYGEKKAGSPRDCDSRRPKVAGNYIMCHSTADAAGAQGVYVWLATRRYAIAETGQCVNDNDCGDDQFCALNGLNRNACEERRREGERCTDIRQCVGGLICDGAPLSGRCITTASITLGDECIKDAQCTTGSCDSSGICQCRNNSDCGKGRYCDTGWATLGRNQCLQSRAAGAKCDDNKQCASPNTCVGFPGSKVCAQENSRSLGDPCSRDAECRVGKCGSSNLCVCKRDSDCGPNRKCKEPIGKPNYCTKT